MSYRGPLLIKEPELRWSIIILAAIITTVIALLVTGLYYASIKQPGTSHSGPRLLGALRPGEPEFEQIREQIEVAQLLGTEQIHPFNSLAVDLTATIRNNTGRTISGLEMRGAIVDGQNLTVRERTVMVIPARQTALEPSEAIGVRVLLENINKDSERANMVLEVTGVRFD
jgi:hypothetical protein